MGGCLRLAAALHTALIVFAWCMIGLWLCCLYALSANDKVAEELAPMNIRYTYGSALKLDKRNLFVGSPKVLINSLFFFGPPLLAAIAVTLASMLPIGAPMFVRTKAQVPGSEIELKRLAQRITNVAFSMPNVHDFLFPQLFYSNIWSRAWPKVSISSIKIKCQLSTG